MQSVCEPMDAVNCLYVAVMPRAPCSQPDDEKRKVLTADKAHVVQTPIYPFAFNTCHIQHGRGAE